VTFPASSNFCKLLSKRLSLPVCVKETDLGEMTFDFDASDKEGDESATITGREEASSADEREKSVGCDVNGGSCDKDLTVRASFEEPIAGAEDALDDPALVRHVRYHGHHVIVGGAH